MHARSRKRWQALCFRGARPNHIDRPVGATLISQPFRAPSCCQQPRPAISSAPAKSETLAGALSSNSQANQFRAPLRRRASIVQRSRGGVQRSRGSSSSHFERPSRAKMARCRKRWQVRCFRGQTEPADRVSYCLERRSRQYIFCVN